MIKVILVDDAYYFRQAMKKSIDWNGLGFDICGEANNGQYAYEMIKDLKPEIAIVDINMPIMDGLELAKKLREENIKTKIIIITGYSEFEYAKQAIKLGTFNYILKPVNNDELVKSLLELRESIERESNAVQKINSMKAELRNNIPILKEHFLAELVKGTFGKKEADVKSKFEYFEILSNSSAYRVVLVGIDNKLDECTDEEERQLWKFVVANICQELMDKSGEGVVFSDADDRVCLISGSNKQNNEFQRIQLLCEKIKSSVESYLSFTVTVGVGEVHETSCGIAESYREASYALEHRMVLGKNRVIYSCELGQKSRKEYYIFDMKDKLLTYMRLGDTGSIERCLKDLFFNYKERRLATDNLHAIYIEAASVCISFIVENGYRFEEVLGENNNPLAIPLKSKTLDELCDILICIYTKAVQTVNKGKQNASKKLVEESIEYIDKNFFDENLCLEGIANCVYTNPTYLSSIFKRETGKTVLQYITEIRMKKAKELLDSGICLLSNIAEKVGYSDSNYFGKCFKKHFGITLGSYIGMKNSST